MRCVSLVMHSLEFFPAGLLTATKFSAHFRIGFDKVTQAEVSKILDEYCLTTFWDQSALHDLAQLSGLS